jgi:hypothetical protein
MGMGHGSNDKNIRGAVGTWVRLGMKQGMVGDYMGEKENKKRHGSLYNYDARAPTIKKESQTTHHGREPTEYERTERLEHADAVDNAVEAETNDINEETKEVQDSEVSGDDEDIKGAVFTRGMEQGAVEGYVGEKESRKRQELLHNHDVRAPAARFGDAVLGNIADKDPGKDEADFTVDKLGYLDGEEEGPSRIAWLPKETSRMSKSALLLKSSQCISCQRMRKIKPAVQ